MQRKALASPPNRSDWDVALLSLAVRAAQGAGLFNQRSVYAASLKVALFTLSKNLAAAPWGFA